jgi:hypothetical protein
LLRNIQVQASGCVDEIAFLFSGGTPAWSADYSRGPLIEDPSGLPADVPGPAHLVVRLQPTSGVDLTGDHPALIYDGPTTIHPATPSGVAQVRRLGDVESVTSWVIGLSAQRPFQVVRRSDQLVVRLPATVPRTTRCAIPGTRASAGYPSDWYTELSDRWACRYFDLSPFAIHPATDDTTWAVTVQEADGSASEVVANMTASGGDVRSRPTRVAGVPATVLDVTESGAGMHPAGYHYRMYVIATTPKALLVMSTPATPGPQADRNRSAADDIAGSVQIA